ncbi:MAG: nitroreductase family protein [Candidatus Atribacteria bacterium]|nr:nitroreductase family protein [Candidatus Atribacteria bacterium]
MDIFDILKTRRSVRRFKADPVPREMIEEIIDCARLAPSAVNIQPWEFIVVTEPERKKAVADLTDHGKFIKEAPVLIAVFCRKSKYFLEDGSAATENILLAAWAIGLGSCWVAGDKKPYVDLVRDTLSVPVDYTLVSLIPLGYPVEQPSTPIGKRALPELIHWEQF